MERVWGGGALVVGVGGTQGEGGRGSVTECEGERNRQRE